MSSDPRAFATVDLGTASVAVALIGQVDHRWRLLGAAAAPAAVGPDALLGRLGDELAATEPVLARELGLSEHAAPELPRLTCETVPAPVVAVVGTTARVVAAFAAVADTAGWRTRRIVIEGAGIVAVASALADPTVTAVLACASDPPGVHERSLVPELATLVAATTQRRPELAVILAGALAEPGSRGDGLIAADRPGPTLLAQAAGVGAGAPLRDLLEELRAGERDGRRALVRAVGTLSRMLERRIEVVEVGQSGGTRVIAESTSGADEPTVHAAFVASGGLVPADADDSIVDEAMAWLTAPLDRLRVRDRLRELAITPWGDTAGDGALLRLAAARAALVRLLAATPAMGDHPAPDLLVAAGGAWSVAPGPAIGLALADVVRRPGISGLGFDHARLLGPLGTIENEAERGRVIADLREDLITPLGSVVMPAGFRGGKPRGHLSVHGDGREPVELDLAPGGLELVDLPPGERAVVELRFRDPVDLGAHGRHFAVEVGGGLGGVLVDLRDVPLRLPERLDRRRDVLTAWQGAMWAGIET